jgi:superfamily II DNA/RNA helicase
MFSATFQPKIEKLASYALSNPVKILSGEVGEANKDVVQIVQILPDLEAKLNWLFGHLVEFCTGIQFRLFLYVFFSRKSAHICHKKIRLGNCCRKTPFSIV